jgi:hypothetical protein
MDPLTQVTIDLKAVLVENHRDFQLLNIYKGVPVICNAWLESVEGAEGQFSIQSPAAAVLMTQKSTILLSDGLLEPIHAQIVNFDLLTSRARLSGFTYAGSKLLNRHELRVEPASPIKVALEIGSQMLACEMVDISMRGVGVRVHSILVDENMKPGDKVDAMLQMPEGMISLPGRIRNIARSSSSVRISIEFTAEVPEKVHVVRYIMRRRAEIFYEIQHLQ